MRAQVQRPVVLSKSANSFGWAFPEGEKPVEEARILAGRPANRTCLGGYPAEDNEVTFAELDLCRDTPGAHRVGVVDTVFPVGDSCEFQRDSLVQAGPQLSRYVTDSGCGKLRESAFLRKTFNKEQVMRLMKVNEVAEVLGLSRSTVYKLLAERRLPSVRIDGSRRVRDSDLDRFVESLDAS